MQRLRFLGSFALVAALAAQGNSAPATGQATPQAAQPAADNSAAPAPQDQHVFVHTFGERGAIGSLIAQFSDYGGGLVWLQLGDHWVDVAASKREPKNEAERMLLIWAGEDFSFRLDELAAGAAPLFTPPAQSTVPGPALLTQLWQREVGPDMVRFTYDNGRGIALTKTFTHKAGTRTLGLEIAIENRGATVAEGARFGCVLGGPAIINKTEASLFGQPAVGVAVAADGTPKFQAPVAGPVVELLATNGADWSMAGSTNRFFGGFLFPADAGAKSCVQRIGMATLPPSDDTFSGTKANTMPRVLFDLSLPLPKQGEPATKATFGVYLGPKSYGAFGEQKDYERFLPILDHDLQATCCVTVPGGKQVAQVLLKLLGVFHGWVGNWGLAIMMLTLLVRGCLAPVNFRMQKSMRVYSARMAVLKPKLDALKTKFGDDQRAYQQAMLAFQREHKLMPPLGGCLPIFLTMPIYIGLFTALRTAYDLRQQSFLFVADLSQPDMLSTLSIWPHNLNILPPIWMGMMLTMMLRQPLPTDPQQRQVQQMMRYMPLMFGVGLYNYAAGLMVYMITSMSWTFVESAIIKRILGPVDPNVAAMTPTPMM